MKSTAPLGAPTQITRVQLKRVDLLALVDLDDALRDSAFCRAAGKDALRTLLEGSTAKRYAAGTTPFAQGDASDALYWLLRGEIRLSAAAQNESVDLGVLGKGEIFGEREMLTDGAARGSSAVALTEVDVVEAPRAIVCELCTRHPAFRAYLDEVHRSRQTVANEMADFLNRW